MRNLSSEKMTQAIHESMVWLLCRHWLNQIGGIQHAIPARGVKVSNCLNDGLPHCKNRQILL